MAARTSRRLLLVLGLVGGLLSFAGVLRGQDETQPTTASSVAQLIERLQSGELQDRREAAWDLAEFGPEAAPAVAALAQAAADGDPQVANGALQALGRIGPAAAVAIPDIFAQLRQGDGQRRYRAAYALGRTAKADNPLFREGLRDRSPALRAATAEAVGWMGDGAGAVVGDVAPLLGDESDDVVNAATGALRKLGPLAVPSLCQLLDTADPLQQQRAAQLLAEIGPPAVEAKAPLLKLATSQQPAVRAAAVTALASATADDAAARDAIVAALGDADDTVVLAAITGVIHLGLRAPSAVPRLIDKLDGAPEIARLAALALGRLGDAALPNVGLLLQRCTPDNQTAIVNTVGGLGPAAVPAVLQAVAARQSTPELAAEIIGRMGPRAEPALLPALSSSQQTDRAVAAAALGRVRRQADTAARLVPLLSDAAAMVRAAAAAGLAQLGPLGKQALPELRESIEDPDPTVRGQALTALVALGAAAEEVVPALVLGLRDATTDVRRQSAVALGQLEALPAEAVGALAVALDDADPTVRQQAAAALGHSEAAARAAVDALVRALRDGSEPVALAAAQALHHAGPLDAPSVDALIALLDHPSAGPRRAAMGALASGGDEARRAVDRLTTFRADPSPEMRAAAIRTLARLAADDPQRLQELTAALDDPDWSVRRQVAQQLGDMGDRAQAAVPRLLELMIRSPQDSDDVAATLRRIDAAPAEAVPMLVEILQNRDADRRQRYYALYLLRKVGPAAKSSLPLLRELRDEAEGRIRESLDRAIEAIEQ
jgi:HEAT repeat protein